MKPFLIIFAGKAGTGKTTLASSIAKELGIAYIDYDTLCQPFLMKIEERYGLSSDRYGFYRQWREECYKTVLAPVIENLKLGVSIIVSAPFSQEILDSTFPDYLEKEASCDFSLLLCYMAPKESVHYEMVKGRNSFRDEDFLNDLDRFKSTLKAEKPLWDSKNVLYLDSGNFEDNRILVLKRVKALMEE